MENKTYPSYLALAESGELKRRVEQARLLLSSPCRVCPRGCKVNRLADEKGECGVGRYAVVSSYGPHFGEEPVLRGWRGSGTVFFAGCNLHCVYCQNYDISQWKDGRVVSPEQLARIFLAIQEMQCHNLNLVTPSHVVPQILEALEIAVQNGFRLPIVYNTSSYDSLLSLKLLDGVVDIYMPDTKYADSSLGQKYSDIKGYFEVAKRMLKEMHRQCGDLIIQNGLAVRGLLIRHLVLPNNLAGTKKWMEFIAREISPDSYVNLMDQYHPCFRAFDFPELSRRITSREYSLALETALQMGIRRGIPFDQFSRKIVLPRTTFSL
ncbi:MAG: radical SAM protein [bacterium JZ-2024 1]